MAQNNSKIAQDGEI